MSLVLDDLPRDPDHLLQMLQQMTEFVTQQKTSVISLQAERDAAFGERDTALAERDAAQAEIEKLRLLIRQLQRGRFGRRSEKLDPGQLQLNLEDLEQATAAVEAAQEAARRGTFRCKRHLIVRRPGMDGRRELLVLPVPGRELLKLVGLGPARDHALEHVGEPSQRLAVGVPARSYGFPCRTGIMLVARNDLIGQGGPGAAAGSGGAIEGTCV